MKAVSVVLKQLMTTRSRFHERERDDSFEGKLEKLRLNLNKIKDVFVRVKKNEEELLDTLAEVYEQLRKLERRKLDEDMHRIWKFERRKLDEEMDGICKRIRECAEKLVPMDGFDESSKKKDPMPAQIFQPSQELHQPLQTSWPRADFYRLDSRTRGCLLSLVIFPENTVIRKRNVINLWIGEGLIEDSHDKKAEELGEDAIQNLLEFKVIERYGNRKCPLFNKFRILHGVRHTLESYVLKEHHGHFIILFFDLGLVVRRVVLHQKKGTLDHVVRRAVLHQKKGTFDLPPVPIHTIFNIGASYLNCRPKWVTEFKKDLLVLQLGRWQDSPLHHIEVGSEKLLNELENLTQLRYLSLRGISRIFELPSSIAQLERLLILDLKACHNLETLPNDISSMKSLTHLILSQCYLLEGMPKGIDKLTNLQVLKGFVISSSEKTPCRISDLVNLKKLRRLSIHIGKEAVIRDREFESVKDFVALEHLKISWRGSDPSYGNIHLPRGLRKLHLECFPRKSFEELFMPPKMEDVLTVRELNISGGKLESMDVDRKWRNVDTLRLKYLKQLNVDMQHLKTVIFPDLRYLEIKQISNHSHIEHKWNF